MKLEILIPHYNESTEIVRRLLDSIAAQQGVNLKEDIGVIICSDGNGSMIPWTELETYPFHVEYFGHSHLGVSATRNRLLDSATADYIMCCDCDDVFSNLLGLYKIIEAIDNGGFDMFFSAFYEELVNEDGTKYRYIERREDAYFVHGKVFNRKFLVDNCIRWNSELKISGDNYFLWQAIKLADRIQYCPMPFYIWKYNPRSVCRGEKDHFTKSYYLSIKSNGLTVQNFLDRKRTDIALYFFAGMIYDAYLTMHTQKWTELSAGDHAGKAVEIFGEYFNRYKELLTDAPIEIKRQAMNAKAAARGIMLPDTIMTDAETWAEYICRTKES